MSTYDREWQDGDDSQLYADGFDEGFAFALGMVFDYANNHGAISTDNAVEVMNFIAQRRAQ